jgi:hypothetical protein
MTAGRISLAGTAAKGVTTVTVAITRLGAARSSTAPLRVKAGPRWAAKTKKLAPGRYRLGISGGPVKTLVVR